MGKEKKLMKEKKENFFTWGAYKKWYFWLIVFLKNLDTILSLLRGEISSLEWIAMLSADFFLIFILFGIIYFLISIFKKKKKDKKKEN